MTQEELAKILELHKKWLNSEEGGKWADLRRANLSEADLRWANLSGANLSGADLRWANLSGANLSGADLRWADLRWANLRRADLSGANLSEADLRWANLSGADLSEADLRWANLRRADLSGANLSEADLSGVQGLLSACNYLDAHFERVKDGYIAYKTFGAQYRAPKKWKIEVGSVIEEVVNPDRTCECGCGINVAPLEWVKRNYSGDIWKVLIRWEWLAGVVVPYHTDGKIRCERVELLGVVK